MNVRNKFIENHSVVIINTCSWFSSLCPPEKVWDESSRTVGFFLSSTRKRRIHRDGQTCWSEKDPIAPFLPLFPETRNLLRLEFLVCLWEELVPVCERYLVSTPGSPTRRAAPLQTWDTRPQPSDRKPTPTCHQVRVSCLYCWFLSCLLHDKHQRDVSCGYLWSTNDWKTLYVPR